MITAEQFARQNAVWHRATPTLEQYTRWANKNCNIVGSTVPRRASSDRSALIAETSFMQLTYPDAQMAEELARKHLEKLPRSETVNERLTSDEFIEVAGLSANLGLYLNYYVSGPVQPAPEFPGCGVVLKASGDVLAGSELIEVKAVLRLFRGTDLRQALTYAALAYSVDKGIDRITLLNPRLGAFFTSTASDLALDIGAGSWVELMQDLVETMSGFETSG